MKYKTLGLYRLVYVGFKKPVEKYINLPISSEYWCDLKDDAKKDGVSIKYKAETFGNMRVVYNALVSNPDGSAEQYYLTTSKKNAKILKELEGK